jgi:hypothetical protein
MKQMLNIIINKKYNGGYKKPPSNDIEEEWTCIKETLIISAQNIIGEEQNE